MCAHMFAYILCVGAYTFSDAQVKQTIKRCAFQKHRIALPAVWEFHLADHTVRIRALLTKV
jgi:hypothetical protein